MSVGDTGETHRLVLPLRIQRQPQFTDNELEDYGDNWPADWTASIRVQPVDQGGCLHYVLTSRGMVFEELHLGTIPCPVAIRSITNVTPREWLALRTWVQLHQGRPSSSAAMAGEVSLVGGSGVSLVGGNGEVTITAETPAELSPLAGGDDHVPWPLEPLGQQFVEQVSEFNISDDQLATMTTWPAAYHARSLPGHLLSRLRRSYRLSVMTASGIRAVEWLHTGSENWPIPVADTLALTPQEWLTLRQWIHDNQRSVGGTALDVGPNGIVMSVRPHISDVSALEPLGRHAFRGELLLSNEELRGSWPPGYRCRQREPDNLRLCRSYHLEYVELSGETVLVEQINLGDHDCDMLPEFSNDISPEEWRNLRDWVDWMMEVHDEQNRGRSAALSAPGRSASTTNSPLRDANDWASMGNQSALLPRGTHVFDTSRYIGNDELRDATHWPELYTARSVASAYATHLDSSFGLFYADTLIERIDLNSTYGWEPPHDIDNVTPMEWWRLRQLAVQDDLIIGERIPYPLSDVDERDPPVLRRGYYTAAGASLFSYSSLINTQIWSGIYSARRLASSNAPTELRRSFALFEGDRAIARVDVGPNLCPVTIANQGNVTPHEWLQLRTYASLDDGPSGPVDRIDGPAYQVRRPTRALSSRHPEIRDEWLASHESWSDNEHALALTEYENNDGRISVYRLYRDDERIEELRPGSYVCDVPIVDVSNVTPREWLALRSWVRLRANAPPQPVDTTPSDYVRGYDDASPPASQYTLFCTYISDDELRLWGNDWRSGFNVVVESRSRADRGLELSRTWLLRYHDMILESITYSGDFLLRRINHTPATPTEWLELRHLARAQTRMRVVARNCRGVPCPHVLEVVQPAVSNPVPTSGRRVISLDADSEDEHV